MDGSQMAIIVALFGVVITAMGLWGVVSPSGFIAHVLGWPSWGSVWIGAASRVLLAVALWIAADSSRTPVVFLVPAAVSLASGLALPFLGPSRLRSLLVWGALRPERVTREWAAVAILFGGFLLWAVFPALPIS